MTITFSLKPGQTRTTSGPIWVPLILLEHQPFTFDETVLRELSVTVTVYPIRVVKQGNYHVIVHHVYSGVSIP